MCRCENSGAARVADRRAGAAGLPRTVGCHVLLARHGAGDRLPAGTRVIVIGNSPTGWAAGPELESGWLRCRAYRNALCPASYPERLAEGRKLNPHLRALAAADPRVTYVDAAAPLCSAGRCWQVQDGQLNYWDGSHMTIGAAARVLAQIDPALLRR